MGQMYDVEFNLIPVGFERYGNTILKQLEKGDASFFYRCMNLPSEHDSTLPHFEMDHFKVKRWAWTDMAGVITVEMPTLEKSEAVYCAAYAIVYIKAKQSVLQKILKKEQSCKCILFTVEESLMGTRCIGRMNNKMHENYGVYGNTIEDAVEHLKKIVVLSKN